MSRVGNKPVAVPSGVKVAAEGSRVSVSGPAGALVLDTPPGIHAEVKDATVVVTADGSDKKARSLHGTARSLIANMVLGVQKGFSKEIEIQGVGFKAQIQGQKLVLSLGFSHPVEFMVPEGIKVQVANNTDVTVSGADKQLVGQVSSQIRSFFPAEPYKGKGVRFKGEHVRRKAGKTVA